MYHIEDAKSSLIKEVYYDEDDEILHVICHTFERSYREVPIEYFMALSEAPSKGKFYLQMIKNNFKMSEKPKTRNKATDQDRWFEVSIDVKKLNKDWFIVSESGAVWANLKIRLLADGEVDQFGNCMMLTQKVPPAIFKKETADKVDKKKRTKGAILGNGCEFEPKDSYSDTPGNMSGTELSESKGGVADDLPF